jgi:LacI family transcriptional regulator
MAAVTLQDVADRAGVSLATASRVLNGSARVPGRAISERVRQAAAELGYVANAQAQALAKSATRLIGLVVHDIADPYFSSITHGVQLAARRLGREVLVADTGMDPSAQHDAVRAFLAHRADAIILAGSRFLSGADAEMRAELTRHADQGGRVAVIGQPLRASRSVILENHDGAAALADALVAGGHREFAVLAGPEDLATAVDRTEGFVAALHAKGVDHVRVIRGAFGRDGGFAAAQQLLASPADAWRGVCVFAITDVLAIGAIAAFRESGLRVPEDLYVAGFDDIPTLRDFVPGLTTVRLPLPEIGEQAVELALGDEDAPAEVSVAGQVVLRESTRRPR